MSFRKFFAIFFLLLVAAAVARAGDDRTFFSEWGAPGLLQTPTARLPAAGTVTTGVSLLRGNHRHVFAGLTPTPWLWLGLRQSAYLNDYGLLEPGVDAALRLLPEGPFNPAVVLGWRDGLGSGIHLPGVGRFAGEHLVASKRWWSLDLSAGVGWGRLGGRRVFGNPVSWAVRDRPATGPAARGPRNWFSGRSVGAFGGVAWRTPLDGLTLAAEISADDRAAERLDDPARKKPGPVNIGAAWRPFADPYAPLELGVGFEGGRDLMLRVMLRLGPDDLNADRPPPPPAVPHPRSQAGLDLESSLPPGPFQDALPLFKPPPEARRDERRLGAAALSLDGATLWLDPRSPTPQPLGREIGRAARWLAANGPPDAAWLTVATRPQGLDGVAVSLPRQSLLRAAAGRGSAAELLQAADIGPASGAGPPPTAAWLRRGLSASLRLGTEESPFEHAASSPLRSFFDLETTWTPVPGAVIGATARRNMLNSLSGLNNWALAAARPVRADLPEYAQGISLERLYVALRRSPTPDWHVGVDAGWLEEMFGGFGGEILHQPFGARWAAGLALHRVWKRPAGEAFRLRYDRGATAGLASFHYEGEGGAWSASLEAGRYLGGDWGGGLSFTRRVAGETTLTAHASWTDGPYPEHAQFGGKMDYGARLTVPLGALGAATMRLLTGRDGFALPTRIGSAVRTLGRDAGQKLDRPAPLWDSLSAAGVGRLTGTWKNLLD